MQTKIMSKIFVLMLLLSSALLFETACGAKAPTIPPKIPHTLDGRENCLSCHESGVAGAPKTPHPDKTNCTDCHKQ